MKDCTSAQSGQTALDHLARDLLVVAVAAAAAATGERDSLASYTHSCFSQTTHAAKKALLPL